MSLARLRALIVLGVLAVLAIAVVVWAIAKDSQEDPEKAVGCPGAVQPSTQVPEPSAVTVKVFNATDRPGLAGTVKKALEERGFTVAEIGNSDEVVDGTGEVRYGPAGVGAAHLLRAEVPQVVPVPDDREDAVVELLIGPDFADLTPADDVTRTLDRLGKPVTASPVCDD